MPRSLCQGKVLVGGFPWEFLPEGHVYLEKREKGIPTSSKAVFWPFIVNVSDSYLIPASGWAAPSQAGGR